MQPNQQTTIQDVNDKYIEALNAQMSYLNALLNESSNKDLGKIVYAASVIAKEASDKARESLNLPYDNIMSDVWFNIDQIIKVCKSGLRCNKDKKNEYFHDYNKSTYEVICKIIDAYKSIDFSQEEKKLEEKLNAFNKAIERYDKLYLFSGPSYRMEGNLFHLKLITSDIEEFINKQEVKDRNTSNFVDKLTAQAKGNSKGL